MYIYYGVTLGEWLTYDADLLQSPLVFDPKKRQQAWRFVSYMLVHAGYVKPNIFYIISVNMLTGITSFVLKFGTRRVQCSGAANSWDTS